MSQLANVKILVLISMVLIAISGQSYAASIAPKLQCGLYEIHGTLTINSNGHFILKAQENSYSPIEVLVLGGSFSDKMRRRNTHVRALVYVPKAITDNNGPFVYLQELMPPDSVKATNWAKEIQKAECGISDYFKQNP